MSDSDSDNESIAAQPDSINQDKFKESVKEWIKIHDRLSEIRRDTTSLNKRKKVLGEKIVHFMKGNDKELCNLGESGTLLVKKKVTSLTLKKEDISNILQQMGKNETEALKTAEFLFENKRKKESDVLQRSTKVLA